MQPRNRETYLGAINIKVVLGCIVAFAVAVCSEMLAESGTSLIDWEAGWAGSSTALLCGNDRGGSGGAYCADLYAPRRSGTGQWRGAGIK